MDLKWVHPTPDPKIITALHRRLSCHPTVAILLTGRGITTPDQARRFLHPDPARLRDPFSLKDMDRAVQRITSAIRNREKILIFGDFDADGITATAILYEFLSHTGAEVTWYIPHRTREGYSLKPDHIRMAADQLVDLIITVDCGSDNHDAVTAGRREDIDVIITDHHNITPPFPEALAIVNPKRPDCRAGLSHLAGVGVAFYLVIALRRFLRDQGFWQNRPEPNLIRLCDLVAIGTMADMVPLVDENRILAHTGIRIGRQGKRPGIKALAKVSRVDFKHLDSDDISFRLAPRINAAGRMAHARICVDLLTCNDFHRAEETASLLDQLNLKRQQTEKAISDEIESRLEKDADLLNRPAIILADPRWNPGVLGIVASKSARRHFKPVILISTGASPATGSCRSVPPLNIHQLLERCRDDLIKFGGHAMAAGITVDADKIPSFSDALYTAAAEALEQTPVEKEIVLDAMLTPRDITQELIMELDQLRPYGNGNPEPLFYCDDLEVVSSTIIADRHRKMVLKKKSDPGASGCVDAFQFNIDARSELPGHFARAAFKVRMNRFQATPSPQMIIEHA